MRELEPNEVIEATDMLQTPKDVKFKGEWSTLLPASELRSMGGQFADGFVGKRVGVCALWMGGKLCKWVRPE